MEEAECEDGEKQEAELRKTVEQTEALEQNEPTSSQASEVTGHVFPEGLAPVIIQSANKKTLKCPKCEKTFDRIGESWDVKTDGRISDKMILFFIFKKYVNNKDYHHSAWCWFLFFFYFFLKSLMLTSAAFIWSEMQ